ncbi:MAG: BadF/BadG/BcrA/BcrD ATPase family protein [Bryobacteraceae bacterium]|jgi:N-acetylglucosamine kinase-like BadF-type ATPase
MMLFLGVDGGQSGTTALVADRSGRVLGAGQAGPCNHVGGPGGRAKFITTIQGSVDAACRQAGVEPRFAAACLGFSGGPADKDALVRELIHAERFQITDDAAIALTGATGGAPGIVTIAGTGSISYGRNAARKQARAGGWGHIFGDEGGAFDLTRQALRAALRFEEGWGPQTALHRILLAHTGASTANDLLHRLYLEDFPKPRIAALARLVDEAAVNGDLVAHELLNAAASQLATITAAVRSQLFVAGEKAVVAWLGGVFRSNLLRERFRMLVELEDGASAGPPAHGPAAGALMEAFRLAGIEAELSNVPAMEKNSPVR